MTGTLKLAMILELVNCGARPPFSYRKYKSENKICHRSDCCVSLMLSIIFPQKNLKTDLKLN